MSKSANSPNFDILDSKPFVLSVSCGAKRLDKSCCLFLSVSQKRKTSKLIDYLAAGVEVIGTNPVFSCFSCLISCYILYTGYVIQKFCSVHFPVYRIEGTREIIEGVLENTTRKVTSSLSYSILPSIQAVLSSTGTPYKSILALIMCSDHCLHLCPAFNSP